MDNCDGFEETLLSLVGVSMWTKMLQIESQGENMMQRIDLIQPSFSSAVERRTHGEDDKVHDNELRAIKQKIDDVEAKIESKMQKIEDIETKMGDVEAKIDAKMGDVEAKIDAKMRDVEAKIESKMQGFEDELRGLKDMMSKLIDMMGGD